MDQGAMIKAYQIGPDAAWTGAVIELNPEDGCPERWTRSPPPTLETGQRAIWNGVEWVVRPVKTEDEIVSERKEVMRSAVNEKREQVLSSGFSYDFGEPNGVRILQTRDAADKIAWLTSQAAYQAAVISGNGGEPGATFRTLDNSSITVSYAAGLNVLLAMAGWGAQIYGRSWELKDAIASASDNDALDAIDIEIGWPS